MRLIPALVFLLIAAAACTEPMALTRRLDTRRLSSELQVEFAQAADAANRAIMAEADDTSAAAAKEASAHTMSIVRIGGELRPLLASLQYTEEVQQLDAFDMCFAEYRALDDEILPLAIENSNLKAQRLSFGPAREAVEMLGAALGAAVRTAPPADRSRAEALATRAEASMLDILALQAPHIAAAEDAEMTRLERQMTADEQEARRSVGQLKALLPSSGASTLGAAVAALDRFKAVTTDIITLSRRNSDVRSLALTLGRKRTVTARCEDQLRALQESLAKHAFTATR